MQKKTSPECRQPTPIPNTRFLVVKPENQKNTLGKGHAAARSGWNININVDVCALEIKQKTSQRSRQHGGDELSLGVQCDENLDY